MKRIKEKIQFKSAIHPPQTESIDYVKWITLSTSLYGIVAWLAGEAFVMGYWERSGLTDRVSTLTLQRTALLGFLAAFKNYFLFGGIVLLTTIGLSFIFSGFKNWVQKNLDRFIPRSILIGLVFFAINLYGGLWILSAYGSGRAQMEQRICEANDQAKLTATAFLANGKLVSGVLLDSSDRFSVILNPDYINVIFIGERPELVYTVKTPVVTCAMQPNTK